MDGKTTWRVDRSRSFLCIQMLILFSFPFGRRCFDDVRVSGGCELSMGRRGLDSTLRIQRFVLMSLHMHFCRNIYIYVYLSSRIIAVVFAFSARLVVRHPEIPSHLWRRG